MEHLHKTIMVRTSFKGTHNWPEASQVVGSRVSFLDVPHRHTFYVNAELQVTDSDREVEFFIFQESIDTAIRELYAPKDLVYNLGRRSCETIAEELIIWIRRRFNHSGEITVEVWEDNEVGARVRSSLV